MVMGKVVERAVNYVGERGSILEKSSATPLTGIDCKALWSALDISVPDQNRSSLGNVISRT